MIHLSFNWRISTIHVRYFIFQVIDFQYLIEPVQEFVKSKLGIDEPEFLS